MGRPSPFAGRRFSSSLCSCLFASALLAAPAHAAWTPGGNLIASGPSNQIAPRIVSDGSGGLFIFWSDDVSSPTLQCVGQHVSADGNTLWPNAGVPVPLTFDSDGFFQPPVSDGQGGAILVSAPDLGTGHAQRVNGSGASQWGSGADYFTTPAQNSPMYPRAIAAGGTSPTTDPSGVIVTWDEQVSVFGDVDIYAQRLDASGNRMWASGNPLAVCTSPGYQSFPKICTDGPSGPSSTHGAYIAWNDAQPRINRISNTGVAAWPNGLPLTSFVSVVNGPTIDYFGSNSVLVAWSDSRSATEDDLFAQKVLPDGTMAWAADGVPICQAAGSRTPEAMMPFGSGGELIAWDDSRTDINDVYVQAIDASGNRLWGTGGRAVCTATNRQIVDALLPDNAGGAYVIWYDKRTGHNELYGQHLDSSGNALWTANGLLLVPLHSLPLSIGSPLADGAGGFYLAWHDKILDTSYDVYVSRFSSSGTLVAGADPLAIDRLRLALASPNPSHGEARFSLELPAAANVTAEVVDLEGRVVRVLARSEAYSAGEHELRWDGRDQSGRSAGAGIYFAHVSAGAKSRTLKLVELR